MLSNTHTLRGNCAQEAGQNLVYWFGSVSPNQEARIWAATDQRPYIYILFRHMVSDHRVNKSETFPSISQWFAGQYGFEFINNTRELLEEEDKNDQFRRLISDSS